MNDKFYAPTKLVLLSSLVLSTACAGSASRVVNHTANAAPNMNQSTAPNAEVNADFETLAKKINFPVRPSAVLWTEEVFDNSGGAVPGPSDRRLCVLLKFDAADATRFAAQMAADTPEKSLGAADVKAWFPADVKNSAQTTDGRTKLNGAKYSPAAFFRAPFQNGTLIRVGDTDYFVLNLFSF